LEIPGAPPIPRRMDWLLASRFDPTFLLVSGGRGAAFLAGATNRRRPASIAAHSARILSRADPGPARGFSSLDRLGPYSLDFRRYALANRTRLRLSLSARIAFDARAVDCVGPHPGGVLASVRAL